MTVIVITAMSVNVFGGRLFRCGQTKRAFSTAGRAGRKQCPCPARGPAVCRGWGQWKGSSPCRASERPWSITTREESEGKEREKERKSPEGNGSLAGSGFLTLQGSASGPFLTRDTVCAKTESGGREKDRETGRRLGVGGEVVEGRKRVSPSFVDAAHPAQCDMNLNLSAPGHL